MTETILHTDIPHNPGLYLSVIVQDNDTLLIDIVDTDNQEHSPEIFLDKKKVRMLKAILNSLEV